MWKILYSMDAFPRDLCPQLHITKFIQQSKLLSLSMPFGHWLKGGWWGGSAPTLPGKHCLQLIYPEKLGRTKWTYAVSSTICDLFSLLVALMVHVCRSFLIPNVLLQHHQSFSTVQTHSPNSKSQNSFNNLCSHDWACPTAQWEGSWGLCHSRERALGENSRHYKLILRISSIWYL